jgi:putative ABC transport system permease protein
MNIAIREGRGFTPDDREGAAAVCMLNQTLAKRLFPNESALGKVILRGPNADIKQEVVGVIADVKSNGLNSPVPDEIYYPMRQLGRPGMSIVAGTNGDPAALQSAIKAAVTSIDNDQPISTFTTLDANVAQSLGVQRIVASLTAIFAGLALALAALGLYSVVAYTVAQRTGEIGIRMALGAQPRQIVVRELGTGMRLVAIGVACGLVCAAAAARLIQTLLFDVTPLDPAVYGSVSAMFVGIAALACLIPSMRASRVDPLQALRAE